MEFEPLVPTLSAGTVHFHLCGLYVGPRSYRLVVHVSAREDQVNIRDCSEQWHMQRLFAPLTAAFSLFLVLVLLTAQAHAQDGRKSENAIFLPFNIELSGNHQYLRDGLTSVLASRIATRTGVRAVYGTSAAQKITSYLQAGRQEKAFKVLQNSGVDYIIMGSLADENGKFLLTVEVVSRKGKGRLKQFTRQVNTIEEALPAMDELAWDVSADIFGVARPQKVAASTSKGDGMSAFQTEHPDRAYKKGMYAGILAGFDSGDLRLLDTRRSPKIPYGINDMDAGDLDGDGTIEIVMAAVDKLYIYRYSDGHFKKIETIDLDGYLRIHAVSLADLNGNGILEIYVSANNEQKPESTVIEWNGREVRFLHKRVPYYLHIATPEGKPVLLGQVGGPHAAIRAVIGREVYVLEPGSKGEYVRGKEISLPKGLTVFDIAYADLDGSGRQKMIAINRANNLQVYDEAGTLLWTDPGEYGASTNYLGTMATAARSNTKIYVPPKIVVHDVTGDGIVDIVVGKNRMKVVKYFKRYRYFEGSSIVALSYQQEKLVPLWETKKLPDYTVACQVVTPQGAATGEKEKKFRLFFAQGQNNFSFGFWQTRSSSLFMYEIGPNKQEDE